MNKSSLKLVSNIMLSSKYHKTPRSYMSYLPFDLLPELYNDVRYENELSEYQKEQHLKKLFEAESIIEDDSGEP